MDLKILVLFNTNLPAHLDDHAPPTYKMTFGLKPFYSTLRVCSYICFTLFYLSSFMFYWLTYGVSENVISDVSLAFLMKYIL